MNLDPQTQGQLVTDELVAALKAVAEPTRLRILMLLREGELNVKDLTQVLDQSQPRLSRHLKLLTEAGLVERFREGSWVYFHISQRKQGGRLARQLLQTLDTNDVVLERDRRRLSDLKRDRETAAQNYFESRAADWDRLRSLHVSETEVETAMRDVLGPGPFGFFVDLGTGTGRVLENFAHAFQSGLGVDVNNAMLSYARSKLDSIAHPDIEFRHGDIYNIPAPDGSADVVVMHQVLHYLSDPPGAITEAARLLKPEGQMLIVDFAPHELEFLRDAHAHERLGFSQDTIKSWLREAGVKPKAFRELYPKPNGTEHQLTVSLWLGSKFTHAADTRTQRDTTQPVEEIS